MKSSKLIISLMFATAALGTTATVNAATGIVNLNKVLANNTEYQNAVKTYTAEQDKLQKDFDSKSRNMTDKQKEALFESYRKQLTQKDQELLQPLQDKLNKAVEKVAKVKNIDTVVIPGGYIYGTITVDLTDDVQKEMN